jgi:hypothetical protein
MVNNGLAILWRDSGTKYEFLVFRVITRLVHRVASIVPVTVNNKFSLRFPGLRSKGMGMGPTGSLSSEFGQLSGFIISNSIVKVPDMRKLM